MRRLIGSTIVGLLMGLALPVSAGAQEAINTTVTRVIDGDTIEVQPTSGAPTTVRLLGIDSPDSATPAECGSEEATAYLRGLVEGRAVVLTTDPSQDRLDRFGRLLAYVDAGTTDVGLAMIRAGHADVFVFEGRPFERLSLYEDAQLAAGSAERGVWGACGGDFHRPGPSPESRSESAERFVRRFYLLLNERRFSVAWAKFSPGLRGRIGTYSRWRSGFRRTLGTRVSSVTVALAGGRAVVRVRIRARDRDVCNGRVVRQFFRGRWVLTPRADSWVATRLVSASSAAAHRASSGLNAHRHEGHRVLPRSHRSRLNLKSDRLVTPTTAGA